MSFESLHPDMSSAKSFHAPASREDTPTQWGNLLLSSILFCLALTILSFTIFLASVSLLGLEYTYAAFVRMLVFTVYAVLVLCALDAVCEAIYRWRRPPPVEKDLEAGNTSGAKSEKH
ncbi:hypothetical protein DFH06DRAFT_1347736 [Mycena polygramma]|nr:hypothetical protein DFH06DRAFT_1347736 [Mycena polygramma]